MIEDEDLSQDSEVSEEDNSIENTSDKNKTPATNTAENIQIPTGSDDVEQLEKKLTIIESQLSNLEKVDVTSKKETPKTSSPRKNRNKSRTQKQLSQQKQKQENEKKLKQAKWEAEAMEETEEKLKVYKSQIDNFPGFFSFWYQVFAHFFAWPIAFFMHIWSMFCAVFPDMGEVDMTEVEMRKKDKKKKDRIVLSKEQLAFIQNPKNVGESVSKKKKDNDEKAQNGGVSPRFENYLNKKRNKGASGGNNRKRSQKATAKAKELLSPLA